MKKMIIEDKFGLNVFYVDEENFYIDVDKNFIDEVEIKKLLLVCLVECYKYIDGKLSFSYLGCLECGICRVFLYGKIVKFWKYLIGEVGVIFR